MKFSKNRSHLSFVHLGPLGLRIVNLAGRLAQLIRKFEMLRFDIYIDIFQNVLKNCPKWISGAENADVAFMQYSVCLTES